MAEEPRRLFKTISLEEKLKGSEYNKLPNALPTSNDGKESPEINIPKQSSDKSVESPKVSPLPATPDKTDQSPQTNELAPTPDKNSDNIRLPKSQLELPKEGITTANLIEIGSKDPTLLKSLIDTPQAQLPPPTPFNTSPLLNSAAPNLSAAQFASSISLEDRLGQSSVTNTTHLPQYFLSDLYTGYLTIGPFTTLQFQDTLGGAPTGLEIPISTNTLEEASTDFVDSQYPPQGVGTEEPSSELSVVQSQGTFVSNDQIISFVTNETPDSENTILIAQGTFISNNIASSFTEVVDSVSTATINQGSIELPIYDVAVEQGISPDIPTPPNENTIASLQGLVIENSQVTESAITLDLLGYETDRALAFASPRIKHGTTVLVLQEFLASKQKSIDFPIAFHGEGQANFDPPVFSLEDSPTAQLAVNRYLEQRTQAVNNPESLHGSVVAAPFELGDVTPQGETVEPAPPQPTNQFLVPPEYAAIDTTRFSDADETTQFSAENPSTLSPGTGRNYVIPNGEKIYRNTPSAKYSESGPFYDTNNSTEDYKFASSNDGYKDFVDIKITSVRKNTYTQVRAYLTSFSDAVTANWADLQYVGRQDTLKQFTGATRAVSFGILLPSFKKEDLDINMRRLETLIGFTTIGAFSSDNPYLVGPLCKLHIGGLINAYVAFGSIKWDFDPAEATMDLDKGLPHLLKVGFDCAVLSTNEGKLLDAGKGGYFTKTYI